jgi:heme/copper-type cytochrome/quinol oxidase subunit 1
LTGSRSTIELQGNVNEHLVLYHGVFDFGRQKEYNCNKGVISMNGCLTVGGIIFLLPFIAFIAFVIKLIVKGKNEAWKGTIIDKNHNTKRDSDNHNRVEHFYSLKTEMTNGKIRNIAVSSEFWNSCKVGDVIEKPKGALYPKKV